MVARSSPKTLLSTALLVAVYASTAFAWEPPAGPEDFVYTHWGRDEGLPQITAYTVVQDARGYLWFGTEEGLVRFDGARMSVFDRQSAPGLRNHTIRVIHPDRQGLWIGTQAGVYRLEEGRVTAFGAIEGLPESQILSLLVDRRGRLWAGGDRGLYRLDPASGQPAAEISVFPDRGHHAILALLEDRHGGIWVGGDQGLCHLESDEIKPLCFTTADGLAHNQVLSLEEDREGEVWIGTFGGLQRFAQGRLSTIDGLAHPTVRTLLEDAASRLWIGTDGGLHLLVGESAKPYHSRSRGLPATALRALWEDRSGNLWMGTRFAGVMRMKRRLIHDFGPAQGLPGDHAWAIYEDRAGNIWLSSDGLVRLAPDGTTTVFTARDGLPEGTLRGLHEDRDGRLWIGTQNRGVVSRIGEGFALERLTPSEAQPRVNAFEEDSNDDLWMGTGDGLFRRDRTSWARVPDEFLPSTNILDLHVDDAGVLWVATSRGLVRSTADSKGFSDPLSSDYVLSLNAAQGGDLWVTTWGNGAYLLRAGELHALPLAQEFHTTVEDGHGRLWMSNNSGISRIDIARALRSVTEGVRPIEVVSYDREDGLPSSECNGGSQPAGLRTRDGRLWFACMGGVVVIDPSRFDQSPAAPHALVEEVTVAGRSAALRGPAELPPGRHLLTFRYTAPTSRAARDLRFRYRLRGFDETWVDAGTRRLAQYTNLSPGSYEFQVIARHHDGAWALEGESFELYIAPAFYQTRLFMISLLLGIAALVHGLYRFRAHHLVGEERARGRVRLLEAKNAEMEDFVRVVAHDLKSPLVTIRGFSSFAEKNLSQGRVERVEQDLQHILKAAEGMSKLLEDLGKLTRGGRVIREPRNVSLAEVVRQAGDAVAGQLIKRGVELVIAPDLPAVGGDPARLVQVFQNLFDNAVKYMGEQDAPRIEVDARSRGSEVVCTVRDNGMGIEPRHQEKIFGLFDQIDPEEAGSGIGLAFVQRVIEAHGGEIRVESAGLGKGSAFIFTLPGPPKNK